MLLLAALWLTLPGVTALLCYNGTFVHWRDARDPLAAQLWPVSSPVRARPRCALTIACPQRGASPLCYNCSGTHRERGHCGGFTANVPFNSSRANLVNCTAERALCFVRSWSARARHAWLVQRGCYAPPEGDPLPHSVRTPMRAMSCKTERYADGEYKLCFCQTDWCNAAWATDALAPLVALAPLSLATLTLSH